MDTYSWQVAHGRFFVHHLSGNLPRNADLCNEIDLGVLCRLFQDVHHELRRDTQQSLQVEL